VPEFAVLYLKNRITTTKNC